MTTLSEVVSVERRYQRSIRIDADLGVSGALHGFVCHGSNAQALETMAKLSVETGQRAFTWTGPYGGGKSSLALALCEAVGADPIRRKEARALLSGVPMLDDAFPISRENWLLVPVVGGRSDPVDDLRTATANAIAREDGRARTKRRKLDPAGRDVLERLVSEAEARSGSGVLVVVDEMGKYLDGAASADTDIHFFQDLAETAGRCDGRLIVVGVLHQSFEQYALRLGREIQDEWAKVQGRFVDIPIVTAIDEVIDLIGRALSTEVLPKTSKKTAEVVAATISKRRPSSPKNLGNCLAACWPLHPVTAALIGPVSRRRFGQNERSVFGFLNSTEPHSFQDFLRETPVEARVTYEPADFWDYLQANLEPAILASPDGHRWAMSADAVERCERFGGELHIRLAKTIALIDLFRNGSGLMAELDILSACFPAEKVKSIKAAVAALEQWSVIVFRKHTDAWTVYAGSDFDIATALQETEAGQAGLDVARLAQLADLQPLLAKKHYFRTGTLRWFESALTSVTHLEKSASSFAPKDGAAGQFLLAISDGEEPERTVKERCRKASEQAYDFPIAVGYPRNTWAIRMLGAEFIALETIRREQPSLEGDDVARREIQARIALASAELEEALRTGFDQATWFVRGEKCEVQDSRSVAHLASALADDTFDQAPIIKSELVNRERPSSNSQAAVRALLHAMVSCGDQVALGIDGFPAERGLHATILEASGLHGIRGERIGFHAPHESSNIGRTFRPMWEAAEKILSSSDSTVSLASIYNTWRQPPFGLRQGVLPILSTAFFLANRKQVAVYVDGIFQPYVTDVVVDRLLQDVHAISFRQVDLTADGEELISALRRHLQDLTGVASESGVLELARAMVEFAMKLPNWTRRTTTLSKTAANVRRILLSASDPHQMIFADLPKAVWPSDQTNPAGEIGAALMELYSAYAEMLSVLKEKMMAALGDKDIDIKHLQHRARIVRGITGDLRLDAFAGRLAEFSGTEQEFEAIVSLVANKPPHLWSDQDPKRALLAIAELSLAFTQAEMLARVQNREPTQHAVGVVFGTGEAAQTGMKSVRLSAQERKAASALAHELSSVATASGQDQRLVLAALAEAGARLIQESDEDQHWELVS